MMVAYSRFDVTILHESNRQEYEERLIVSWWPVIEAWTLYLDAEYRKEGLAWSCRI